MNDQAFNAPSRPTRSVITPAAVVSWILGVLFFAGSLIFFIVSATQECATIACTLNSTIAMSVAAFGIFFGLTFIIFGLWAVRKAMFRAEAEERRSEQMRRELEEL